MKAFIYENLLIDSIFEIGLEKVIKFDIEKYLFLGSGKKAKASVLT